MVRVTGDQVQVSAPDNSPDLDLARYGARPKVRVWDSPALATVSRPAAGGGWLDVEGGVQIRFAADGATYPPARYWNIPARTALGDVLWPREGGQPRALPAQGIRHRYARLGLVSFDGTAWTGVHDCRALFAPLAAQTTLAYVSGDGQDALPVVDGPGTTVPLDKPLVAGVSTGSLPTAGARVRFAVTAGSGTVGAAATTVVTTDGTGLASVPWAVDSATASQQVTATLLADGGTAVGLPVIFTAELRTAARTAYQPGGCAELAGVKTVQDAIDTLCAIRRTGCTTLTVPPGSGLAEVLDHLAPGEDADICLQPGEYRIDKTVVLANLSHVRITGSGEATRILGPTLETVLVLRNCASVQLCDFAIAAGTVKTMREGTGGALTVENCPRVRVDRVRAECGSASRSTRPAWPCGPPPARRRWSRYGSTAATCGRATSRSG